jgi:hypothetical protein
VWSRRRLLVEKHSGDGQGDQLNPSRDGEASIQYEARGKGMLEIRVAFEENN